MLGGEGPNALVTEPIVGATDALQAAMSTGADEVAVQDRGVSEVEDWMVGGWSGRVEIPCSVPFLHAETTSLFAICALVVSCGDDKVVKLSGKVKRVEEEVGNPWMSDRYTAKVCARSIRDDRSTEAHAGDQDQ